MSLLPGMVVGLELEYVSESRILIRPGFASPTAAADVSVAAALPVDLTVSGAGGLCSDYVEAANQLYDVWLISKSLGADPAGFMMEAGDPLGGATFPPGYVPAQSVYLGAIANMAGGSNDDIQPFVVNGSGQTREITYEDADLNNGGDPTNVLSIGAAVILTSIDMSLQIPARATTALLVVSGYNNSAAPGDTIEMRRNNVTKRQRTDLEWDDGSYNRPDWEDMMHLDGDPSTDIEYIWLTAPTDGLSVWVRGFRYDVGGE